MTIKIERTKRFDRELKKYLQNNPIKLVKYGQSLQKFVNNPLRPGLKTEKITSSVWTFRIDYSDRVFFIWVDKKTVLLISVGPHDKYRQY